MSLPLGTAGVASSPLGLRAVTADVALRTERTRHISTTLTNPNTQGAQSGKKDTYNARAVVALAPLHTILAQMPNPTTRITSPLLSTAEPSSTVPTTESSPRATEPSRSLGARTGDVADFTAAVAFGAGGGTGGGESARVAVAGGGVGVFGAVAGLVVRRNKGRRSEVSEGDEELRRAGETYDVTLLAALVARLCFLLHSAVTGDMALKTT